MTLDAPEWMRGPMDSGASRIVMKARRAWIVTARRDGHTLKEIAGALGIKTARVACILSEEGVRTRPVSGPLRRAEHVGIKYGSVKRALHSMPVKAQDRIAALAARKGLTFAETLVSFYAERYENER